MERERVTSSNLRSVGYDPAARVLEIEFVDGNVYQYAGVPPSIHQGLMSARSKGAYLSEKIRDHYRYVRVR